MLNTIAATCLIAMASNPEGWTRQQVLQHEWGHCNCPTWQHGEDPAAIVPPKQCQGRPKMQVVVVEYPRAEVRKICRGPMGIGDGRDGCVVDIWR